MPAETWDEQHHEAVTYALTLHNVPPAVRERLARAFMAHWLTETGRNAEYNFNVANMHPSASWHGDVYVLPGQRANTVYQRAYDSLGEGAEDYVRAMTSVEAYAGPTIALASGDIDEAEWYTRIRAGGWTANPATGQQVLEYRRALDRLYREFPDSQ